MSTAADLLDTIALARTQLRAAEQEEADARKVLRAAQDKLKAASKRYYTAIDEALDEKKRPGLPFDEAATETKATLQLAVAETKPGPPPVVTGPVPVEAPTWHKLLLKDSGWDEEWSEVAWNAIYNLAKVRTAGELARLLLDGATFALEVYELQDVFAAIEMISESDDRPIKFGKTEPSVSAPTAPPVVKGEPIEPLGLTAAELDKAVCPGKIGRAGDKPKALPVVTVNGRPHVVVAGSYAAASSGLPTEWKIRPIWNEKEFPSRYAGELSESVQRSDIYLGVKVLVGKGKAATVHRVGPKHEERKLIEFSGVKEKSAKKKPAPKLPPGMPTPKAVGELLLRDVPKFPKAAADHLNGHGINTLIQLAPHVERMVTMGDHSPVYAALRTTFKLPECFVGPAGDALVDHLGHDRYAPVPKHPAPPLDRTHVWEQRVADLGLKSVAGQDPKRMREQITDYRTRDDRGRGFGLSIWGEWSEFNVMLTDGEPVRVLAKPEWNGARYLHHIEFWSDQISSTKYWSVEVNFSREEQPQLLAEWCREHIQQQADAYRDDQAAKKPVQTIDVLNLPKPKRVRKPKAVAQ